MDLSSKGDKDSPDEVKDAIVWIDFQVGIFCWLGNDGNFDTIFFPEKEHLSNFLWNIKSRSSRKEGE